MRHSEQRLCWSIQALAQPADVQLTLFPDFVVVPDELALEFDQWLKTACAELETSWTPAQRENLKHLDRLLEEMSGEDKPELWLKENSLIHSKWSEVRARARESLAAFGWPAIPPPRERGDIFVGPND